jgi:SAM-dependent methyltransferase
MSTELRVEYTQFGCGLCAPKQWCNFDSSPLLRLQRLPLVGPMMPSGPFGRFPINVRYGDIVRGLPIPSNSVELLYCSHVLEHLSLHELRVALHNAFHLLRPGGIFRLVLPDLTFFAQQYINSNSPNAALAFMRETYLGKEQRRRNLVAFMREWLGSSQHLWMWDYSSLSEELENSGFQAVRRAIFGDSGLSPFAAVEDPERWENALGIQCQKAR